MLEYIQVGIFRSSFKFCMGDKLREKMEGGKGMKRFSVHFNLHKPIQIPRDEPTDAPGGSTEVLEGTQEVRLEEYRGWSRGTWTRDQADAQEAPGCENRGTRHTGTEEERPPKGHRLPEGGQACEVSQGESTDCSTTRECLLPRLGCRTPRSGDGYCNDPRYHPPEGCPSIPCQFRPGQAEVGGAGAGPSDPRNHGGSPFPTPEECRGYCNVRGRWIRCRDLPS
jgi:hypothetical protein